MKKPLMLIVCVFLAAALPLAAETITETIGDYTWEGWDSGSTVEITRVSPAVGNVVIPSTLGGKPVTGIGANAFLGCSGLTGVTIPDSVTDIKFSAFSDCSGLTSVSIGNGVTSIGDEGFRNCYGLMNVVIPDSVTSIGNAAFYCCSGLTGVTIGSGVVSIGTSTFYGCSGLMSVRIPDSVTSIGNEAFAVCVGLKYVKIPGSVGIVGEKAFSDCIGLTGVDIETGVTSIGASAFSGCNGLNAVVIPDSVRSIGASTFVGCSGLTSLIIGEGVKNIGASAFVGCRNLTTVKIPNGVTTIGTSAFCDCSGLTSVLIGNGVTGIGKGAFESCSRLTDLIIPDNVSDIGGYAFAYCEGLKSVRIGKGMASIGIGAFADCKHLARVVFDGDSPLVEETVFDGVASGCVVYVPYGANGFTMDSSGKWQGMTVKKYYSSTVKPSSQPPGKSATGSASLPYGALTEGDITDAFVASKATTLMGAVYDGDSVVGIVELKLAKVNAGSRSGRVSGSVTGLDGKRNAIKASKVMNVDGVSPKRVSLEVKNLGTMTVSIGGGKFAGSLGGYHVQSANVGGNWYGSKASVSVNAYDLSMFTGDVVEDLLPLDETASVSGRKWDFGRAATVKWAKVKDGVTPLVYDEATGDGLVVDTKKGSNISSIKLAYTPKKGTFRGSFKVYELQGTSPRIKLKKYTVKVSGVVVDGVGTGMATCNRPAINWSVTVTGL